MTTRKVRGAVWMAKTDHCVDCGINIHGRKADAVLPDRCTSCACCLEALARNDWVESYMVVSGLLQLRGGNV